MDSSASGPGPSGTSAWPAMKIVVSHPENKLGDRRQSSAVRLPTWIGANVSWTTQGSPAWKTPVSQVVPSGSKSCGVDVGVGVEHLDRTAEPRPEAGRVEGHRGRRRSSADGGVGEGDVVRIDEDLPEHHEGVGVVLLHLRRRVLLVVEERRRLGDEADRFAVEGDGRPVRGVVRGPGHVPVGRHQRRGGVLAVERLPQVDGVDEATIARAAADARAVVVVVDPVGEVRRLGREGDVATVVGHDRLGAVAVTLGRRQGKPRVLADDSRPVERVAGVVGQGARPGIDRDAEDLRYARLELGDWGWRELWFDLELVGDDAAIGADVGSPRFGSRQSTARERAGGDVLGRGVPEPEPPDAGVPALGQSRHPEGDEDVLAGERGADRRGLRDREATVGNLDRAHVEAVEPVTEGIAVVDEDVAVACLGPAPVRSGQRR